MGDVAILISPHYGDPQKEELFSHIFFSSLSEPRDGDNHVAILICPHYVDPENIG